MIIVKRREENQSGLSRHCISLCGTSISIGTPFQVLVWYRFDTSGIAASLTSYHTLQVVPILRLMFLFIPASVNGDHIVLH